MIPYRSQRVMAVPKTLETRIEIMRAVHKLMAELAPDSGVQKFDPGHLGSLRAIPMAGNGPMEPR